MDIEKGLEICPLDGRYFEIKKILSPYFSEYAYMKKRVLVEIKWLLYLIEKGIAKCKETTLVETIALNFNEESYLKIKEEEKLTRHDVKAVEYFINKELKKNGLDYLISFVHFGLTSEDINNTSYALMIKEYLENIYYKEIKKLLDYLEKLSKENKKIPMLAHTHGQPATPTTIGKEFKVYVYRIESELKKLKKISIKAKFNGATGNYSAMSIAYPNLDLIKFSKDFINSLNLTFNPLTTQIENHDYIVTILDITRHINNIILDLDIDMWLYISKGYFKLKVVKNEVGSSTMPHKVNPIRFENSEANLEFANGILVSLSNKLPRPRMQRDLSDSSSLRNLGMSFGYSLQGIRETTKGLEGIKVDKETILEELGNKWEVLAEPIQTILRKYQVGNAYEKLKELTRGQNVTKEIIQRFINTLEITKEDKELLLSLTPSTYLGLADKL